MTHPAGAARVTARETAGSTRGTAHDPGRRRHGRAATALGAVVTGVVLLSSCGIAGGGGSGDDAPAADATGAVDGAITFQTWNLKASYGDYFQGVIADFEEANPGASVEWVDQPADGYAQKVQADASTGNLPDVVNITPDMAYPLAQAGVLADVSGDAEEDYLGGTYLEGAVADYTYDTEAATGTFAYPWYLNTGPVFYNRALFEQAGLDPDTPPTTFDELRDQALAMAEDADGQYAMLGAIPTVVDLAMYGVDVMDDDLTEFTFDTPEAAAVVAGYQEMYREGGLLEDSLSLTYTGTGERFLRQQIALTPGSAYDLENFRTNAPDLYENVGITEPITSTGSANMFSQGIGVSASSGEPATADAFARFVTNAENQEEFSRLVSIFPSTQGSLEDPYFTEDDGTDEGRVRVAAAQQLETAVNYTPVVYTAEMEEVFRREMSGMIADGTDPQQGLTALVEQLDALLVPSS